MKICRWCHQPIARTVNDARNWHCPPCDRWDATCCLVCGTTVGFPRDPTSLPPEQAATSPTLSGLASEVRGREQEHVARKITVYCDLHYHDMYFTDRRGDTRTCTLCGTSWDRRDSAQHKVT